MPADSSRIPPPPAPPTDLRADARYNRERILRVAREVFATHGIDAPVSTIARHAGVGTSTLYRRFPTRDHLIAEVFAGQAAICTGSIDLALADPDPWRGFASVLDRVTAMQVADQGFSAAFLRSFPGTPGLKTRRSRAERGIALLIRRAKEAGVLRPDFDRTDLTLLFMAVDGIRDHGVEDAHAAARRLVAHLLRSFRAVPVSVPPLPPPAPVGLYHPQDSSRRP